MNKKGFELSINFIGSEMDLIETLKEQAAFGFTGKINVLLGEKRQYIGAIYQKDGHIVHADYEGHHGKKSLFNAVSISSTTCLAILRFSLSNSSPYLPFFPYSA